LNFSFIIFGGQISKRKKTYTELNIFELCPEINSHSKFFFPSSIRKTNISFQLFEGFHQIIILQALKVKKERKEERETERETSTEREREKEREKKKKKRGKMFIKRKF
jgi:hypothetical protein